MEITINGKSVTLETPVTIAAFLQTHGLHEKMVVVEHNGEILARVRYAQVTLQAGDVVEIVQMMAGG